MSVPSRLEAAPRAALPGIAKVQALTEDEVETLSRKSELRWLASRLAKSNRRAAPRLGIKESTLRGLCHPKARDRVPSDELLKKARDLLRADELRTEADLLEAV